nr:tyrosine-type recombinase/integrase [Sporolactobacillus pectinivorans]
MFPQLKKTYMGKQYTENVIYHEMLHENDRCSFNKRLTPHKLRHTFTSLAAEAEIPLDDIRAMLGHYNDEITRKVYEHVTKNRRKKCHISSVNLCDKSNNFLKCGHSPLLFMKNPSISTSTIVRIINKLAYFQEKYSPAFL